MHPRRYHTQLMQSGFIAENAVRDTPRPDEARIVSKWSQSVRAPAETPVGPVWGARSLPALAYTAWRTASGRAPPRATHARKSSSSGYILRTSAMSTP